MARYYNVLLIEDDQLIRIRDGRRAVRRRSRGQRRWHVQWPELRSCRIIITTT